MKKAFMLLMAMVMMVMMVAGCGGDESAAGRHGTYLCPL